MISQRNIDKLNNFMKFYSMIDVVLFVFNDFNLVAVPILIVFIKLASNCDVNDQILTNNNKRNASQNHDDEEFVNQLDESVIIDNTSQMIATGFGNSIKQLIISFFIAAHSAHGNNLNDNYFHFRSDPFANYYINASMFSVFVLPAEIDTTGDWNAISAMWDQLLPDTMKAEATFPNLPIIREPRINAAIMRKYNAEQACVYNTTSTNFYYRNKAKDDFEATLTKTSFAEHSISLYWEEKVECLEYTDAVFGTLFGNTTKHVVANKTKSGHYDSFDTITITPSMWTQRCSSWV